MEQIADSINGLVSVARQSQQTQQINILHQRPKGIGGRNPVFGRLVHGVGIKNVGGE